MLTGKELGAAIESARRRKGVTKKALADHFHVKPPTVQDWVNRGTIDKARLPALWAYFADTVPPSHWGLARYPTEAPGLATEHDEAWPLRQPAPMPADPAQIALAIGDSMRGFDQAIREAAGPLFKLAAVQPDRAAEVAMSLRALLPAATADAGVAAPMQLAEAEARARKPPGIPAVPVSPLPPAQSPAHSSTSNAPAPTEVSPKAHG